MSDLLSLKPKTKTVPLPEHDTEVTIRKLSQADMERMTRDYKREDRQVEGLRFIVCRTVVNEQGERIYSEKDLPKLAEVDFDLIKTIAKEAMRFSGLPVDDGENDEGDDAKKQ